MMPIKILPLRAASIVLMTIASVIGIYIHILNDIRFKQAWEHGVNVLAIREPIDTAIALILILTTLSLLSKRAMKISVVILAAIYPYTFGAHESVAFWREESTWGIILGNFIYWTNYIIPVLLLFVAAWVWFRKKDYLIAVIMAPAYVLYLYVAWFVETRRRIMAAVALYELRLPIDLYLVRATYWHIALVTITFIATILIWLEIKQRKNSKQTAFSE
jgi:hypothetical protein